MGTMNGNRNKFKQTRLQERNKLVLQNRKFCRTIYPPNDLPVYNHLLIRMRQLSDESKEELTRVENMGAEI